MQIEYKNGMLGEPIFGATIEELLPAIKEALDNPDVKCVRLFKDGKQIKAENDIKTTREQLDELLNGD